MTARALEKPRRTLPPAVESNATSCQQTGILCVALAALAAVAYAPMLAAGFLNFDDYTWVATNPHVNSGISIANIKWAFTSVYASNYVPLTWISHMLDCQLFGLTAGAHHATNILIHAANTVAFFLLLQTRIGGRWPAAMGAALFGLHPIHVESVAWVAERKDVLSTFFFLLTIWAYGKYVASVSFRGELKFETRNSKLEANPKSEIPSPKVAGATFFYCLSLVLFTFGLMSKPMVVTLPFILLLLDIWPLGRIVLLGRRATPAGREKTGGIPPRHWHAVLLEKLPFMVLASAACLITFFAQRSSGTMSGFAAYTLNLRIGNALISYIAYLGKLFAPVGLPVVEPLTAHPLISAPVLGAVGMLAGITVFAMTQFRRRPWLSIGWLWYLGTLVPVIGIVQVGGQSMAYRYTYIPFMGLSIALAGTFGEVLCQQPRRRRVFAFAGSTVALGMAALTWRQALFWHDNERLYHYSLDHTQRNWMVLNNLGVYLAANQRYMEAIPYLEQVLMFAPEHFQAANTLGVALEHGGRQSEAAQAFQRALQIRPQDYNAHENLITVLIELKRFEEALQASDQLLSLDANRCASVVTRGTVLLAAGRIDEAVKTFERALTIEPSNDAAKYYLGMAWQRKGEPAKAVDLLEQSLKLKDVQKLNRFITLGGAYRDLQQYQKSVTIFRDGLKEFPRRTELIEPLGHVEYTFLKDYSNALPHFQLMLQLDPNHPQRATYLAAMKYISNQFALKEMQR
jgi:tetratricopeptide (TPR) repeat protein